MLAKVGLGQDAAATLERAHAAETDAKKRQQILLILADLYAEGRQAEGARRGQADQAAAETAKLLAPGAFPDLGVAPPLLAAQLYMLQGRPDAAEKALVAAEKRARSVEERREVAATRADVLARSARTADLTKLLERWVRSDDPCLRAEAARRSGKTTP